MIFDHIAIEALRIPMRVRFAQSNQNTQTSDSVLVKVHTRAGIIGYGECCPRTYVTGESAETVIRDCQKISTIFAGHKWSSLVDLCQWIRHELPGDIGPAATCGLEMALLDAWARTRQQSLQEVLEARIPAVTTFSGVIPMGSRSTLEPILSKFQFSSVKVKIGGDLQWNLDRIRWVRQLLGEHVDIRVDVNGGWTQEQARLQIPVLLLSGIRSFEQPLAQQLDHQMPSLMEAFGRDVLLMADESVTSLDSAHQLIRQGAFNAFNLKLSKHGGVLRSLELAKLAHQHLISCQLGAHFGETSLLAAAGLIFSSIAPRLRHVEGGLGTWLLDHDICENSIRIDHQGKISRDQFPLSMPGWGLSIKMEQYRELIT